MKKHDQVNPFGESNRDSNSVPPVETRPSGDSENPYASPREVSRPKTVDVGLWQDWTFIVAHREAKFPPYCVRCNEPAQRMFRCRLLWSYPIDFSTRSVTFEVGVCKSCVRRYRKFRWLGWGIMLASFGVACKALPESFGLFGAAVVVFVIGLYFAAIRRVPLRIKRGKPPYFWIEGAHLGLLERFPLWQPR